jgi:hypothetical protein
VAYLKVIPEEHATYEPSPKEWTTWHTNLKRLLDLVHLAVAEDQEKRRLARKCGNAKDAELE